MDSVKPTVVIGLGEAGRRIVEDTEKVVASQLSEGAAEAFQYIVIDTEDDVTEEVPASAYPIQISEPNSNDWYDDSETFHYLSPQMEGLASGEKGATRQRAVSRYHIEKRGNRDKIQRALKDQIDEHMDEVATLSDAPISTTSNLNVWLANSLGGGTGSGAFPWIALMLDEIERQSDYGMYTAGIGGTPELDIAGDTSRTLADVSRTTEYGNTYAALRELAALVNYEGKPVAEHYGRDGLALQFRTGEEDEYRPSSSPFDFYCLLSHDPDDESATTYSQINRVAGSLIMFMSLLSSLENFPDTDDIDRSNVLYSVDASEVQVPVEPTGDWGDDYSVRDIVAYSDEISDIDERIDKIKSRIENRKAAKQYLSELIDSDIGSTSPDDFEDSPIDPELIRQVKNSAEDVGRSDIEDGVFGFEETVDTLVSEVEVHVDEFDGGLYDSEHVVQYLYGEYLGSHLERSVLPDHPFHEEVAEWLEYLADSEASTVDHEDGPPLFGFSGPVEAWNNELAEYLEDVRDDYEEKAQDQSVVRKIPGVPDYEAKKEEYERIISDLKRKKGAYEKVRETKIEAESKARSAQETFEDTVSELKSKIDSENATVRDLTNEKADRENAIERVKDNILETTKRDKYTRVGLGRGITADEETVVDAVESGELSLDTLGDITDLFQNEYLPTETVVDVLDSEIESLSGAPSVQNRGHSEVETVLCLAGGGRNFSISESEYNVLKQPVAGQKQLDEKISEEFTHFSEQETIVETDHGFDTWLVGLYTNLELENLYEYSHFHDHFVDEARDVGSTPAGKGGEFTDEDLARHFAYPEFLEDGDRIRDLASM